MSLADKKYEKDHLRYLDSARGIAAMMVLLGHFSIWRYPNSLKAKSALLIFNTNDAVSFFFVLSGFVLSYKYMQLNAPLDIKKYVINRIFRLVPAFAVAVIMNAFYFFRHDLNFHTLFDLFILNEHGLWDELYIFHTSHRYFGAGWTLNVEMAISLFVPFIIIYARKDRRLLIWLMLLCMLLCQAFNEFVFHFSLGIMIACYFNEIRDVSFKKTLCYRYRYLLFPIAYILFSLRQINNISHLDSTLLYLMGYFNFNFFFFSGIASFVFLAGLIISRRAQLILQNSILLFYGRISYGIYLMHWMIVSAIFDNWNKLVICFPNVPTAFIALMILCIAISTFLATILHYTIELPFMQYGKRLISKMRPSIVI